VLGDAPAEALQRRLGVVRLCALQNDHELLAAEAEQVIEPRKACRIKRATSSNTSSPNRWPYRSLIDLNRSISAIANQLGDAMPASRARARLRSTILSKL